MKQVADNLRKARKILEEQNAKPMAIDEPPLCAQCSGSGEGQHDGTRCMSCKGSGTVKTENEGE